MEQEVYSNSSYPFRDARNNTINSHLRISIPLHVASNRSITNDGSVARSPSIPSKNVQMEDIESQRSEHSELADNEKGYYESNAGDGTKSSDHFLTGWKLIITMMSAFLALFIAALDQTIVVTIFSTVGNQFHAFDEINWLTSAFLIPMAVFCPSWGRVAIAFGRKPTMLCGIAIFEIGSLIAALSISMSMLIGGRVIQGIGGGCIQTSVSLLATESVPVNYRSLSLSAMAVAYAIASVAGPFLGGALTKVTWRLCFYINLPLGVIAFIMLFFLYNPPKPTGKLKDRLKLIDYFGSLLLIASLVLMLTGLSLGGVEFSWVSPAVILMVIIGFATYIVFLMYNFILSANPMFLKEFYTTPQIFFAATMGFFNYAFFLGNITYLTVYFQVIFAHDSLQSGIDLLPLIIATTISAVINGVLIKLIRHIKVFYVVFSGAFGIIAAGLITTLDRDSSVGKRIGYLIIMGISVGFQIQSTLLSCQIKAPKHIPGSIIMVTVFANFNRFTGGALGVTLASAVFNAKGSSSIEAIIMALPNNEKRKYVNIDGAQLLSSPKLINKIPDPTRGQIYDALMDAIITSFYLGLGFSCAAFVCSLFATNKKIPKDDEII